MDCYKLNSDYTGYSTKVDIVGEKVMEYTIYPYKKQINMISRYGQIKDYIESASIVLPLGDFGRMIKIPCYVIPDDKILYISITNFEKFWKSINLYICRTICMRGEYISSSEINKKVNLSLLEHKNSIVYINDSFEIAYKGKEQDIEKQRLISKRNYVKDNKNIKFIYSKDDNLIHDKTCNIAVKLQKHDFEYSEHMIEGREICPLCKREIIIRNATKNEPQKFTWYENFFLKRTINDKNLEKFLCNENISINMPNANELQVHCNEDSWIITYDNDNKIVLYHNNYIRINDTQRRMTSGYHRQKNHPAYLTGVLNYIMSYSWQRHLENEVKPVVEEYKAKEHKVEEHKVAEEKVVVITNERRSYLDRMKTYWEKFKNIFKMKK